MIREIVEDKESEGEGEGEGRPVREEGREKIFGMFKGRDGGEVKSTGRQTNRDKQPTCSL